MEDLLNSTGTGIETDLREISTENIEHLQSSEQIVDEVMDFAKITVTIGDQRSPIILLFGPRSSGKSMTLVRLSRFLRKNGYTIIVDRTFRGGASYEKMCNEFDAKMSSTDALQGNANTDFILVKIVKNGKTICQLLEAPGEHYFDEQNIRSTDEFPPYMIQIMDSLPNRKIWIFITEPNWSVKANIKNDYVKRIKTCKEKLMGDTDRIIIMYNKIDRAPHLIYGKAKIYISEAKKAVNAEYPNLFDIFKNMNPITSLWRKYNCSFVPFSTGSYTLRIDGGQTYVQSTDEYPNYLWLQIIKSIQG